MIYNYEDHQGAGIMLSRVAVVVPYTFIPPRNGGHHAAYGLCEFLNFKVAIRVLSTFKCAEQIAPFPIKGVMGNTSLKYLNPVVAARIYKYLNRERISHVIAHQPFIALLLVPVCKLLNIQLQIYVQNIEYQRFRSLGKWWWPWIFIFEYMIFHLSDFLYFISEDDIPLAKQSFRINQSKTGLVPFGTRYNFTPTLSSVKKQTFREEHGYLHNEYLIIFFGPQSYKPNLQAVELLVERINPILRVQADFKYRLLICGGGLPDKYRSFNAIPEVAYLGYVEDIEYYVQNANVMINPVTTGGGVKTKLIESIALGTPVVSSKTGALGVDPSVCGNKLVLIDDFDFQGYADAIIEMRKKSPTMTSQAFYQKYHWSNAVETVLRRTSTPKN